MMKNKELFFLKVIGTYLEVDSKHNAELRCCAEFELLISLKMKNVHNESNKVPP